MVFDHPVAALAHGAGYERIADATCSATTMRRRRDEWVRAGLTGQLRMAALGAYECAIGLDLYDVAVDGCTEGPLRRGSSRAQPPSTAAGIEE